MSGRFKTMRHIETVRNYLNLIIREILNRAEEHDQSKLQEPEVGVFEEYTPKLRESTYGSKEYNQFLEEMKPALDHHYKFNRHHPEHFTGLFGGKDINLIDLLEMLCDWKAATMRHKDGDIFKSIEINQKRFNYSDELKNILINTARLLEKDVYHKANES